MDKVGVSRALHLTQLAVGAVEPRWAKAGVARHLIHAGAAMLAGGAETLVHVCRQSPRSMNHRNSKRSVVEVHQAKNYHYADNRFLHCLRNSSHY